jgi:dienelactone hydrolase
MDRRFGLGVAMVATLLALLASHGAIAQEEFPPPSGKGRVRVPTVMFAGENDTYHNCCLIDKARAIGKAAQAAGAPFELTTYPNTPHGFNLLGASYKAQASSDAFARTESALKRNMN